MVNFTISESVIDYADLAGGIAALCFIGPKPEQIVVRPDLSGQREQIGNRSILPWF
jgi:hypothetical protein